MDVWSLVAGALTTIGGFAVATAKDLIGRHFQRKDKEHDRQAAREDAHQAELRAAYSECIAARSRYLGLCGIMLSESAALAEQRQEAYDLAIRSGSNEPQAQLEMEAAGNKDLIQKARKTIDEMATAAIESDKRMVNVLLLEADPEFSRQLLAIYDDTLLTPQHDNDLERYRVDVHARHALLETFVRSLAGRFAATPSPARPMLASVTTKELKAGGDGKK